MTLGKYRALRPETLCAVIANAVRGYERSLDNDAKLFAGNIYSLSNFQLDPDATGRPANKKRKLF